jgi:VanZ family protein
MLTQLPDPLTHPKLWYSLAFAALLIVGIASLVPAPGIGSSDKLLHFITYFVLSAGFTILNQQARTLSRVAAGLILYGVLLEILQGLTSYRMMDVMDMLTNGLGVLTGLLVWLTPVPVWFRQLEIRILSR